MNCRSSRIRFSFVIIVLLLFVIVGGDAFAESEVPPATERAAQSQVQKPLPSSLAGDQEPIPAAETLEFMPPLLGGIQSDEDEKPSNEGMGSALDFPASGDGTITLVSEGFEGIFPNGLWRAVDGDGATNGNLYWGDVNYTSYSGGWSAWAADEGPNGLDPAYHNYANNMKSWLIYGPFDLSSATAAELVFKFKNRSEANYDYFQWLASPNGSNFYGLQTSGDQSTWRDGRLDLANVPGFGRMLGDSSVWIAFRFASDGSVTYKGPFIDDVIVRKTTGLTCTNQYKAEYFNNVTLSGSPTFSRCESWPLNANWGSGGPGNGVGADNFSVRWTGQANIAAGNYVFKAVADDGIRVWLDNTLIIDAWRDQAPTEYRVTRSVAAGLHAIKVEYYERTGGATAQFRWDAAPTNAVVISNRPAFDTCGVPSTPAMQAWWSASPYREANIYMGGENTGCRTHNATYLTSSWVSAVRAQGWNLIPTWVGLQAPCGSARFYWMSWDPNISFQEGRNAANAAAAKAQSLGLTTNGGLGGTIIYLDIEGYPNNAACRATVKSYVNGWTQRLHELGNRAGSYGSACASYVTDWAAVANIVDDIWPAAWYQPYTYQPGATVWNVPCVADSMWFYNQRIRQYTGGHYETWDGVTINIDSDIANGHVAGTNPRVRRAAIVTGNRDMEAMPQVVPAILREAQVLPSGQGWAVIGNRLYWTEDMGNQWRDRTPVGLTQGWNLRTATFAPDASGWILAGAPPDVTGRSSLHVVRLEGQGTRWMSEPLPFNPIDPNSTQGHSQIVFVNDQTGFVALQLASSSSFSLGTLFKTGDGGRTWTELSLPVYGTIGFVNTEVGWVSGGTQGRDFYRTQDSGRTWTRQEPLAGTSFTETRYSVPQETVNGMLRLGAAAQQGSEAQAIVLESHDGGRTWDIESAVAASAGGAAPQYMVADGRVMVGRTGPALEGGTRSFEQLQSVGLQDLSFADEKLGWALINGGNCTGKKNSRSGSFTCQVENALFRTTDGGSTWAAVSLPNS